MKKVLILMTIMLMTLRTETLCAAQADWPDGDYGIAVTMSGGSGRATVESPAQMSVQNGRATAQIRFSSPNYDYMRVGEQTYYPVNTEGNSTFEIPVTVFDAPMEIVADTTAMSTPHEITYTLVFDSGSVSGGAAEEQTAAKNTLLPAGFFAIAAVLILLTGGVILYRRGRKTKNAE